MGIMVWCRVSHGRASLIFFAGIFRKIWHGKVIEDLGVFRLSNQLLHGRPRVLYPVIKVFSTTPACKNKKRFSLHTCGMPILGSVSLY